MSKHSLALILVTTLVFSMGLLMVFDTTAAEVLNRSMEVSTHHALLKQIVYAAFGLVLAVIVWFLGYEKLIDLSPYLLGGGIVLLILVFFPFFGQQINGAHRWFGVGPISFQPSEFVKLLIPIYFIHVITSRKEALNWKDFSRLLCILFVPLALILFEPDNGTVVMVIVGLMALFFLTKIRWIYWVLPLMIICLFGGVVASRMSHVPDRIRIYLNPELDLKGKGHQPHQARIAAGSGRVFGKGVAGSMQKLDYLPEARSDYIAAIFGEEYGFIGIFFLVFLYMSIGYFGFYIAFHTSDLRGFYLCSIVTFIICFQAFLNLGVVCGLLPSKGTNLPFFSQGGSSLIANFAAIALILNVGKHASEKDSHRSRRDRRTSLSRASAR